MENTNVYTEEEWCNQINLLRDTLSTVERILLDPNVITASNVNDSVEAFIEAINIYNHTAASYIKQ